MEKNCSHREKELKDLKREGACKLLILNCTFFEQISNYKLYEDYSEILVSHHHKIFMWDNLEMYISKTYKAFLSIPQKWFLHNKKNHQIGSMLVFLFLNPLVQNGSLGLFSRDQWKSFAYSLINHFTIS